MYGHVRDDCPNCGYPSYANGYCHECGLHRRPDKKEWKVEKKIDLVEMMNSEKALEYGFELMDEDDKQEEDE